MKNCESIKIFFIDCFSSQKALKQANQARKNFEIMKLFCGPVHEKFKFFYASFSSYETMNYFKLFQRLNRSRKVQIFLSKLLKLRKFDLLQVYFLDSFGSRKSLNF